MRKKRIGQSATLQTRVVTSRPIFSLGAIAFTGMLECWKQTSARQLSYKQARKEVSRWLGGREGVREGLGGGGKRKEENKEQGGKNKEQGGRNKGEKCKELGEKTRSKEERSKELGGKEHGGRERWKVIRFSDPLLGAGGATS